MSDIVHSLDSIESQGNENPALTPTQKAYVDAQIITGIADCEAGRVYEDDEQMDAEIEARMAVLVEQMKWSK